jgi:hypothetical protein
MPVTDDLRAIADRANQDLDAVHDFFEHSKIVWQSFQILVDEGHTLNANNSATGTTINQTDLLARAPHYMRTYLVTFTFRQFVSVLEGFLFAFLQRVFEHNPWQFARSQLDFEAVSKATNREEIISSVVQRQLNELKYDQLREWFVALNKATNLGCPSDDEIEALAEVKAARDILEHNAGLVNEIYLRKAGKKARYAPGAQIEIDDFYHLASWQLIKKTIADLTSAALVKLGKP